MSTASLDHLDAQQLRALAERLMGEVAVRDEQLAARDARIAASDEQLAKYDAQIAKHDQVLHFKDTHIEQLKQELALYKRWRYGKHSEQLNPAQASLLEETMDADMAALEEEVEALRQAISPKPPEAQAPRRMRQPPELPRTDIHHEPSSTTCRCGCGLKRISEDVSEKLDYLPGVFSVERHIRGGHANSARRSRRRRCPRRSSTRASRRRDSWRRCWWPSSPITCRCTVRKAFLRAPGWRCRVQRWASGSACVGCGCSRWWPGWPSPATSW